MPRAHAERLVAALPAARAVLVEDSATLVPFDRPAELVDAFVTGTGDPRSG